MKFLVLAILTTLLASSGFAGTMQVFNSSNLSLGSFGRMKCGTGMTCTRTADGKVNLASSPTLVNALTLTGAEATDASITVQADESDDSGDDWKLTSVASDNTFTIGNDTSGSQVAKLTISTGGDLTVVGAVTGDGGDALSGFLQKQVAATATTITAAQCGSTFYNTGAVAINLPNGAAGLIGCRLTFVTLNASNFDVNPGNSDQIMLLTDAAGDSVRNATIGNVVTLQYAATNKWIDIAHIGTWSDIN